MANRPGRRRFGNIRKRPSGRWQASYIAPDGLRRYAGGTFDRKGDAERWLSVVESEILRGEWLDPLLSAVSVEEYARAWIKERQLVAGGPGSSRPVAGSPRWRRRTGCSVPCSTPQLMMG
jgi:hypothetical protein